MERRSRTKNQAGARFTKTLKTKKPTRLTELKRVIADANGYAYQFVVESNHIEGINRAPTGAELAEFDRFMALDEVTIEDMEQFVRVYQPDARLRSQHGMNVHIGLHVPPSGGPHIRAALKNILRKAAKFQPLVTTWKPDNAFWTHITYEHLHPFTDGNGRSGRMLWCWQMQPQNHKRLLSFLHAFYYQALSQCENRLET